MLRIIVGVFLAMHGLVHMLYFGQSARYFELQPGMIWPDGAWIFSRFFGNETTRTLASVALVLATLGFVTAAAGAFFRQSWWLPVTVAAAVSSTIVYIVFWDGILQQLPDKGAVGILINAAILACVLVFHWPDLKS